MPNLLTLGVGGAILIPPTGLSGLQYWFQGDQIVGLSDGDLVATWPDGSGFGLNATQSSDIKKATWQTNEVNGLSIVRFDGVDDSMVSPASAAMKPCTLFSLVKFVSGGITAQTIHGGTIVVGPLQWRADNSAGTRFQRIIKQVTSVIGDGPVNILHDAYNVLIITYSSIGEWAIYKNGALDASGTNNVALTASTLQIGANAGLAEFAKMDLEELGGYNRVLNDTERRQLVTYLGTRGGIAVV